MTLTANLNVQFSSSQTGVHTIALPNFEPRIALTLAFEDGVGLNQADLQYVVERTLAASASDSLDLAAGLVDAFNQPIAFAEIVALLITTDAENKGNLQVGGAAADSWHGFLGDATDITGIYHPAANTVALSMNGGGTLYNFDGTGFNLAAKGGALAFAMESTNNSCTWSCRTQADDPTLRSQIVLGKSRQANIATGGSGIVQKDDSVGGVAFQGWSGASNINVARMIAIMTDPIPGVGTMGAKVRFQGVPIGSASLGSTLDIEPGVGLTWALFNFMDDGRLFSGGAGTGAKPTYTFAVDPDTGMYRGAANTLVLATNATDALLIDGAQRIAGTKLHDNASLPSGTASQFIASGTYTPSLFNTVNMAASVASACQWIRVGNVVTVSGKVNVDPTAAVATTLGISLPIPSLLTADNQCSGAACCAAVAGQCAAIIGDAANDHATMQWTAVDLAPRDMQFTFAYVIL